MASPARLCAKEKAAIWKANKEKIAYLVSCGLELYQVEEELQRIGCRITAQVRECILWEKRAPEVRELLAKGFDVAAIEERMRLNEWTWTDNIKKKALWEFHREEIIGHYKTLRSVEAVREIMAKKGFMPKTRIYYEWLNSWGIPTSIDRRSLSEIDALTPQGSNNPATPGSANIPYNQLHGTHSEPPTSDIRPVGAVDALERYRQPRVGAPSHHRSGYSSSPMPAQDGSLPDEDDISEDGDDIDTSSIMAIANDATPLLPSDVTIVPPWSDGRTTNASGGRLEHIEGLQRMIIQQNTSLIPQHNSFAQTPRGSIDSAIGLLECSFPSHRTSSMRKALNQGSNSGGEMLQKMALHSISCAVNHQATDFNFHCCGSSRIQDLALSIMNFLPQHVYDHLCRYMLLDGVRLWDHAGNTFLHKLAITGAPWAYFKAGINAHINPCHRNAFGQTFAHVLDFSTFHSNLKECLVSLREIGIDLGSRDAAGRTVLHCLYGQTITPEMAWQILELIDAPGRLLSRRDVSGRTPYEVLQHTLLQQTSATHKWSGTELQQQMVGNFEDIVDRGVLRLTDKGVDWSRIADNLEGLRAALQTQYKKVIDNAKIGIVVEAVDGSNAFHAQAALTTIHDANTDLYSLKKFIAIGIDTNDYDKYGRTPLEAIITLSRDYETELTTSEKVSLLIDKGNASVDSRNRLGHTPLYSAAIRGLDRTVEALLLRGSHVNIRGSDGESLLQAVIEASRRAFGDYYGSPYCRYHEAQVSRIEECKVLLERYGAVRDPTPVQAMGYAPKSPFLQ